MRHGATVIDDYFWLREKDQSQSRPVSGSRERLHGGHDQGACSPSADALYKEMLGRIKQTDLSVPSPRRGYLYYSRTEEGKQYPIQCRRKGSMEAPEEVLLDLNELGKDHKFVGLGGFAVSDDQNLLAYTIDYTGFRQYSLQVKDLRTGADAAGHHRAGHFAGEWAADNKTIFLTTEDAVTKRSDKLWRHVLGAAKFEELYNEKDELYDIEIGKTRDRKYLLLRNRVQGHRRRSATCAPTSRRSTSPVFLPREKGTATIWIIARGCSTSAPTSPAVTSPS